MKVAILDLYNGIVNEGMRCISEIVTRFGAEADLYEVRVREELPNVSDYDVFISSGGPGDPHEIIQKDWGKKYREFLDAIYQHNAQELEQKHLLLICHSFQMACIHWDLAEVTLRAKPAFGVYPMYHTESGYRDQIMGQLEEPFWVVDSRDWQVIQPNMEAMQEHHASVLVREKYRPHVPYERACMAFRVGKSIWGTQFHPEGDDRSMEAYIYNEERRRKIIELHGEDKAANIAGHLGDPHKLQRTYETVLPEFLRIASKAEASRHH